MQLRPVLRRYWRAFPRLRSLAWRDWADLASAQVALLSAQLRVWRQPVGTLTTPHAESTLTTTPEALRLDEARRLALAISRAAAFGLFRPACLVRSLALCRIMKARGIDGPRVVVGVIVHGGHFVAHAWVNYGGVVLGDDPDAIAGYGTLPGLDISPGD